MYLLAYIVIYGEIKLGRNPRTDPIGSYDEDYHHYLYQQIANGNYNCYKVTVAMNGSARQTLTEQISKEEYFKRKLDGTSKEDGAVFRNDDV